MEFGPATWQDDVERVPGAALSPDGARPRAASRWSRLSQALRARRGRIRNSDVVVFVRLLATLLNAGLPLSKALRTVARQIDNPSLAAVVVQLGDDVQSGEMLSAAMSLMPKAFDPLTVNIVRAGEAGGTLPKTLTDLAADLEKTDSIRRNVLSALIYPAVVVGIATLVVGFLLIYVVPVFEGVYQKMHLQLPLATRVLLATSRVLVLYWWVLPLALAALLLVQQRLKRVERTRRAWDRLMLRLPLLGKIRCRAIASRFLGTFATLVASGVSIVETLRLMSALTDNLVVRDAIEDIRRHVSRGGTLGEPMMRYADLFSPMAIQMLGVGEQTGSLPEAAQRTAAFLAQDVDARVKTLMTLIEPMLTVGLGVVVGTIALAIYMPMFDLMKNISR